MKQLTTYVLLLGLLLNFSCKKEEVDEPITVPYGIIKSASISNGQQDVGVYDTLVFILNYPYSFGTSVGNNQAIQIDNANATLKNNGENVLIDIKVINKVSYNNVDTILICPQTILKENGGPYVLDLTFNVYKREKGGDYVPCNLTTPSNFKYTFYTKQYNGATGISESDIDQSYPAINQYHYLPKESSDGFLKLKPSKDIYINTDRWEHFVKFYRKDGEIFSSPALFNPSTNTFTFSTPQDLSPETIYSYALYQKPKGSSDASQTTQVFKAYFRTSKFATFKEKWATFKPSEIKRIWVYSTIHAFSVDFTLDEELDAQEEKAFIGSVRFAADTSDRTYKFRKFIYDGLPTSGYKLEWTNKRNPYYGVPPINAYTLVEKKRSLTPQQVEADNAPTLTSEPNTLRTDVYIAFYLDGVELSDQIWYKVQAKWNTYDKAVIAEGNYMYETFPDFKDMFNRTHAQYFVGDKMTSEVLFNWR